MLRRENVLITNYSEPFDGRTSAGYALVDAIQSCLQKKDLVNEDLVVLGVPRGGIMVAAPVAEKLSLPLDFVVTRKLRIQNHDDLVIGAVTERGRVFLNKPVIDALDISSELIQQEINREKEEIHLSVAAYRSVLPANELAGKTIIIVDDNVITGSTMFATLRGLWAERPNNIILAVPIAPRNTIMALSEFADFVVALKAPAENFTCMGDYYLNYDEVQENDVVSVLKSFVHNSIDPVS
jgi:putative phosphoribosyl transferase